MAGGDGGWLGAGLAAVAVAAVAGSLWLSAGAGRRDGFEAEGEPVKEVDVETRVRAENVYGRAYLAYSRVNPGVPPEPAVIEDAVELFRTGKLTVQGLEQHFINQRFVKQAVPEGTAKEGAGDDLLTRHVRAARRLASADGQTEADLVASVAKVRDGLVSLYGLYRGAMDTVGLGRKDGFVDEAPATDPSSLLRQAVGDPQGTRPDFSRPIAGFDPQHPFSGVKLPRPAPGRLVPEGADFDHREPTRAEVERLWSATTGSEKAADPVALDLLEDLYVAWARDARRLRNLIETIWTISQSEADGSGSTPEGVAAAVAVAVAGGGSKKDAGAAAGDWLAFQNEMARRVQLEPRWVGMGEMALTRPWKAAAAEAYGRIEYGRSDIQPASADGSDQAWAEPGKGVGVSKLEGGSQWLFE